MASTRPHRAAPRGPYRILLVDDHPMVRERLAEVIQREADLVVCGEADDRAHALAAVETSRPDLAIIDLTLKNSHGLELIKDLRIRAPHLAILVVSMHDESLHAERVIYAGARGYITKQEATRNILHAIRTVLQGNVFLSDKMALRLAAKIARQPGSQQRASIDTLTDRELGVFEMIGQGCGTRQIARALRLHMRTVETYRARIKEKLHLKDADELRQFAIRWQQSGSLH
ncbi:MAG TPA: response regulator transcription factor [Methylomirabilota bacterium]|nr:response regulator transcription factor [Methylomirabilota bacterium]